jgi:hypothetical protein
MKLAASHPHTGAYLLYWYALNKHSNGRALLQVLRKQK